MTVSWIRIVQEERVDWSRIEHQSRARRDPRPSPAIVRNCLKSMVLSLLRPARLCPTALWYRMCQHRAIFIHAEMGTAPTPARAFMAYNSAGRQPQPRSKESSDMLVLSRKLGEKIVIGDNITITIVDIDRGKIRLGIEAPRDVPIFRQELLPLKATENPPPGPVTPTTIVTR